MKRVVLGLMPLLMLAGCDKVASDGYTFERAETVNTDMRLTVVVHPSETDLRRHLPRGGVVEQGSELMAFAVLRKGQCEVHTVDARVTYAPEWMGHELAHCIYGRWHK